MRRLLFALAAVTACSADQVSDPRLGPSSANFDSNAPVHSVTGSGRVEVGEGVAFASSIAVHQDATGQVWGNVSTHIIDLAGFGLPGRAEMQGKPECMRVVGNTAYIGIVITQTTDPRIGAVGSRGVAVVQDNGSGTDKHFGGPGFFWDPSNLICSATPPFLPAVQVSVGNFTVR